MGGWVTDEDGEEVWVGPFEQVAPGPAPDHPDTRAGTTSRIRASVVLAAVALALIAVCLVRVERTAGAADALRATGVRVTGTVTEVDSDDDPTVSYLADGEQRSEVVSVEYGDHRESDTVAVVHHRSDPGRMSIDEEDDESSFSSFVTGAAGPRAQRVHLRGEALRGRATRTLAVHPLVAVRDTYVETGRPGSGGAVVP